MPTLILFISRIQLRIYGIGEIYCFSLIAIFFCLFPILHRPTPRFSTRDPCLCADPETRFSTEAPEVGAHELSPASLRLSPIPEVGMN